MPTIHTVIHFKSSDVLTLFWLAF